MQLATARSDVSAPDPLRASCGRRVLGDDPWVVEAATRGPRYGIKAYTAREWDPETNLYYYRARYYDPKVGRFIGEDPIGFSSGDANFYAYVGSGPTNSVDPSGLLVGPAPAVVGTGAGIGGAVGVGFAIGGALAGGALVGWIIDQNIVEPWQNRRAREAEREATRAWELYNAVEKGENYITDWVKRRCQETDEDPCDVLREMMRQAKRNKNKKKIQDIKKAEKYLGCRRSRQGR